MDVDDYSEKYWNGCFYTMKEGVLDIMRKWTNRNDVQIYFQSYHMEYWFGKDMFIGYPPDMVDELEYHELCDIQNIIK